MSGEGEEEEEADTGFSSVAIIQVSFCSVCCKAGLGWSCMQRDKEPRHDNTRSYL